MRKTKEGKRLETSLGRKANPRNPAVSSLLNVVSRYVWRNEMPKKNAG